MNGSAAIDISNLTKSYRIGHLWQTTRPALCDLSLTVGRGEVFGYLGPNGAGKTTTLKLLFGFLRPEAGQIRVLGLPAETQAWRFRTGYLPENPYLYDYLTAAEYLDYAGRVCGVPAPVRAARMETLLREVGMWDARHVSLRRVSKGMLQRVGLAQALINDPELVVLDEPMSGLDPVGRKMVKDVIRRLRASGCTVLFSTHILSDAEALCDRVALLRAGRLVAVGRLDEILTRDYTHLEIVVSGIAEEALRGWAAVRSCDAMGERLTLEVDAGHLAALAQRVEQGGGRVLSVQPIRQSLEDFFLEKMEPRGAA